MTNHKPEIAPAEYFHFILDLLLADTLSSKVEAV